MKVTVTVRFVVRVRVNFRARIRDGVDLGLVLLLVFGLGIW